MQAEQFDELAKTLAAGRSRRGLLAALAGGVAGALAAAVGRAGTAEAAQPAPGTRCFIDAQCGPDGFCERPGFGCFGRGVCRTRPEACTAQFDPVCGCNGRTYSNACVANAAGVSVARRGPCPGGAFGQFCGGIAGIPCPDGYRCIDDPRDDCDPRRGGADCGGICVPAGVSPGVPPVVPPIVPPVVTPVGSFCRTRFCGPGEYCCNFSCGICAPVGGACTQQVCP